MAKQNLTPAFLDRLQQTPPASRTEYCDTELSGFFLEFRSPGKGTYYLRYRDNGGKTRQQRLGKLGEMPLSEARSRAHLLRQQVRDGHDPQKAKEPSRQIPTLEEFAWEGYLPFAKSYKRSWKTDETLLRLHLLPVLGQQTMDSIRRKQVFDLHQDLRRRDYAAATCNRVLVLLKYVFNCAISWEVLPESKNPCNGVTPFAGDGDRERFLSDEEVRCLLAELNATKQTMVADIIRMLLYTGARRSEMLQARWEHIDLRHQLLTVPVSKSGKPRYIALPDAAVELLKQVPRDPDIPWVFFNPKTGKPRVSIYCAWNTIRTRAGIPDVRLHDLRHSYASFLVRSGRTLFEVQKLLGHSDPKMTMRYAHLSPRSMVEAANVMGTVMDG